MAGALSELTEFSKDIKSSNSIRIIFILTLENVSSLYNICEKSGVKFNEKQKRKLSELYDLEVEKALIAGKRTLKIAKLAETQENKEIEEETEEEITL